MLLQNILIWDHERKMHSETTKIISDVCVSDILLSEMHSQAKRQAWAVSRGKLGMRAGYRRSYWSSRNQDKLQMSINPGEPNEHMITFIDIIGVKRKKLILQVWVHSMWGVFLSRPVCCGVCWARGWAGPRHIWRSCKVVCLSGAECLRG